MSSAALRASYTARSSRLCALRALTSSALAVAAENGAEIAGLIRHAENLLYRFTNTALADTVARVGRDTKRKLGANDRLVGALSLCEKHGVDASYICIAVAAAMLFAPEDDASSAEVRAYAAEHGVAETLRAYAGYAGAYTETIAAIYADFKAGKTLAEVVGAIDKAAGKNMIV